MEKEDMESLAVGVAMAKQSSIDKECTSGESSGSVDSKNCSRRYSTGKPNSTKRNQKITPNYLRASTGSCHDFCKYGIKHGNHQDDRPWRKKPASNSAGKKSCVVTVALPERRKSMIARQSSIPINKSHLSEDGAASGTVSSPHAPEIIKREISVPQKKFEASLKQGSSSENGMLKKGKQPLSASRQSLSYKSVDSDQNTKKAVKRMSFSPLEISTPSNSQLLKARRSSSIAVLQPEKSKLSSSEQRGGSTNTGTIKSSKIKANSPYSLQVSGGPDARNQKRDVSRVKTKLPSSSKSARTVDERGKKSESVKTLASNRPSLGKTANIKPKIDGSLKAASPVKEENTMVKTEIGKTSDENVSEKTLHVVEMQTTANLSESTEGMDMSPPLSPGLPLSPGMSSSSDEEVKVLGVYPDPHESNISPVLTHQQGMVMSLSDHEEVGGGQEELVKGHMEEDEEEPEAGEVVEKEEQKEEETEEEEEDTYGEKVEQQEQQVQHREVEGGAEEEEEEMETEVDSDDDDGAAEEENMYESDGDEGDEFINSDETVHLRDVEKINRKPLKKGYILSESGVPKQVKLKFRRGKIMDIQSETTTGPRRLRFRQRRTVDENHVSSKNDITKRNFTKGSDIKGINNSTNKEEKIVLRHQDSQGRKDGQGLLLNNVIEETASKLAETRKSKVKALVGAFETVISLQDSKPSVQLMV